MSIKLKDCSFTYMAGTPLAQIALHSTNLEIASGELVALVGHTGSGKSTLAQLMNGLLHPDTGTITVDDVDLKGKKQDAKQAARSVGMVFQYPEHQLFGETVYEDIAFGPKNKKMLPEAVEKAVRFAMDFVGLNFEEFKDKNPLQLSGGQMRRVAIAGVVAMEPKYLILDEPAAGLDPMGRRQIFGEVLRLHKTQKIGIIVITHNMEEAMLTQRLLVLDRGRILYDGKPEEFFLNHRQELLNLGLAEPEFYQFYHLLQERGMRLRLPEDEQQLLQEIKRIKGWK